jgi:hypothetical protein
VEVVGSNPTAPTIHPSDAMGLPRTTWGPPPRCPVERSSTSSVDLEVWGGHSSPPPLTLTRRQAELVRGLMKTQPSVARHRGAEPRPHTVLASAARCHRWQSFSSPTFVAFPDPLVRDLLAGQIDQPQQSLFAGKRLDTGQERLQSIEVDISFKRGQF